MNFTGVYSFIVQENYIAGTAFNVFITVSLWLFSVTQQKILISRGTCTGCLSPRRAHSVLGGCPMPLAAPRRRERPVCTVTRGPVTGRNQGSLRGVTHTPSIRRPNAGPTCPTTTGPRWALQSREDAPSYRPSPPCPGGRL